MPDTGLFYVLDLDSIRDDQGNISRVNYLSVRCNQCRHVSHSKAPDLESVPGGTLLKCTGCGERQAVSNARLIECDHVLAASLPAAGAA